MIRRPPRSTRTDTLVPYTTLFRSNLQALLDACADPGFPATIVRVVSNEPDAPGLQRAEAAGVATTVIRYRDFPDRKSFAVALVDALRQGGVALDRKSRRLNFSI